MNILITGDFCPINRTQKLVDDENFAQIFGDFKSHLEKNDLNITNLECPLYEENTPIPKIGPNIKAKKNNIKALTFGGFNLLALANNHIMDHGELGLKSTIDCCDEHNIAYVGGGLNEQDATKVHYFIKNDLKVAIINIAENEFGMVHEYGAGANPLNPIKNFYTIQEAKKNADFVFLIIHGGHEYYQLPSPRMIDTYRYFIDLGVDAVVGHHTHCFSGYEQYNNGLIFYSLGNFIFDWHIPKKDNWYKGFAVEFKLEKNQKIEFNIIPYIQNKEEAGLRLLSDLELENFNEELSKLNEIIKSPTAIQDNWQKMQQQLEKWYLTSFIPYNTNKVSAVFTKFNLKLPYSKRNLLKLHNLVRCESHKDILMEALRNKTK
jgi:poly-gamma-glutamate capsule biosynthesis protein CapA/YwtB (metallophosphatase superfamily)